MQSIIAKIWAYLLVRYGQKWKNKPIQAQEDTLKYLISSAQDTYFGTKHNFEQINSYEAFKKNVPLASYEDLLPYIERIKQGAQDILWHGTPKYFTVTSGSVAGSKFIPLTQEALKQHIRAAREAVLLYVHRSDKVGKVNFLYGKYLYLSGNPTLTKEGHLPAGRLSGIVNYYIPSYLRKRYLPKNKTNIIENFDEKIAAIIQDTAQEDIRVISGITPWMLHYFEKLLAHTHKKSIAEVFPNLGLFIHGGVNHSPYQARLASVLGEALVNRLGSIELYPASEGFIAYQDTNNRADGLLLLCAHGIFYEFIPIETYHEKNPKRVSLSEVVLDQVYAVVLSTNTGLWGYLLGDTVRFTSLNPPRVLVTGRVQHELSAFGEHVIAQEVERAMERTMERTIAAYPSVMISEFTVAPYFGKDKTRSYHEWWIEFSTLDGQVPALDIDAFTDSLDKSLQDINHYYYDLREGNILASPRVVQVQTNGFLRGMQEGGNFDPQKKIPRLSNDREFVNKLMAQRITDA